MALIVFFGGFNFIEAQFPATVATVSGPNGRGAGLGVYATAQFLGAFAGGVIGGVLATAGGPALVLAGNAVIALVWLGILIIGRVR
jgi:MFS family permease